MHNCSPGRVPGSLSTPSAGLEVTRRSGTKVPACCICTERRADETVNGRESPAARPSHVGCLSPGARLSSQARAAALIASPVAVRPPSRAPPSSSGCTPASDFAHAIQTALQPVWAGGTRVDDAGSTTAGSGEPNERALLVVVRLCSRRQMSDVQTTMPRSATARRVPWRGPRRQRAPGPARLPCPRPAPQPRPHAVLAAPGRRARRQRAGTNALRHTPGPCGSILRDSCEELAITVWDTSTEQAMVKNYDRHRVGGHGLHLVHTVSDRVAVIPGATGKQTTAYLRLTPTTTPAQPTRRRCPRPSPADRTSPHVAADRLIRRRTREPGGVRAAGGVGQREPTALSVARCRSSHVTLRG